MSGVDVLNPQLYQRLLQIFDEVKVANEGVETHSELQARLQVRPETLLGQRGDGGLFREVIKGGEYYRVNCFAPETLVVTPRGDVRIADLVGTATLLIPNRKGLGSWKRVKVQAFGRQPLLTVKLRRKRATKVVRATADHRWILSGRCGIYEQATTGQLRKGDRLATCFARKLSSYAAGIEPSSFGIAQGFVFGDGSRTKGDRRPACVRLYAAKDAALIPYFQACRGRWTSDRGKSVWEVVDLPRSWKELPSEFESLSFLFGWLAGYFAADGWVGKNGKQAVLYSANADNLNFAKGVCYQLGIRVSAVRAMKRSSDGCVPGAATKHMFCFSFATRDVPDTFWLQGHHRSRVRAWLASAPVSESAHWLVDSVEDVGDVSDVYCAVVPGVEKFTLADNLLTMNCPFCGDSKFRLWISYRWSDEPRLAHCYNETECMKHSYNRSDLRLRILGRQGRVPMQLRKGKEQSGPIEVSVPGDIIPLDQLPDEHEAIQYLMCVRQPPFDPDQLARDYGVGYCVDVYDRDKHWALQGRIYAPCYMDGKLFSWQGRYPDDLDWKETRIPKYFNCPGAPRAHLLYGFDEASRYDDIVLVEGTFDRWRMGFHSMALLSCKLTPAQRLRLLGWRHRGCVAVMLDGEAGNEADEIVYSLSSVLGERVFRVALPNGVDPGGMSTQAGQAAVIAEAARRGFNFSFAI